MGNEFDYNKRGVFKYEWHKTPKRWRKIETKKIKKWIRREEQEDLNRDIIELGV